MKKTKIVCTLGPDTNSLDAIKKLRDLGMSIARLNGSHNTLEWHRETIKNIRAVDPLIPILVDLPGRKIRTAKVSHNFQFNEGDLLTITTQQDYKGTDKIIVNYPNLHEDLAPGNTILADDGTLKFQVLGINGKDINIKAQCSGVLKSAKGINVPFVRVNTPLVNDRDIEIINMCKAENVDFIGVSFVESGDHLKEVFKYTSDSNLSIISKVENQFALDNLESILESSFGILIDRGDLSAETEVVNISIKQKEILKRANRLGKPVIVATEMLHTMIENPVPTKAEVNDITNAVLDGASAVMMSGETAAGKYPFEACSIMAKVIQEAENFLMENRSSLINSEEISVKTIPNLIGHSVSDLCKNLPITKVVCLTHSGFAASQISRYRLKQDLIIVTDSVHKARAFNFFWGGEAHSLSINFKPQNSDHIIESLKELYVRKILTPEDLIIVTAVRFPNPKVNTKMNYLEVHKVSDLVEIFEW